MNSQKIMRVLFLLVPVLLLLSIFWHAFAPFLSLALLYLMLLVIRSGFVQTLLGRRQDPPVYYRPPEHPGEASAGGFGLTPPEHYPSPATPFAEEPAYERGYQAQPSWPPGSVYPEAQPKQEYDQPQVYYPEMELPPQ
jgi:hypothetical protein